MSSAVRTKDHDEIRRWAEDRGGIPAIVKGTGGLLRIDFIEGERSGGRARSLEEVPWERWFQIFDEGDLTFLCSREGESRFFKLVAGDARREKGGDAAAGGRRSAAPRAVLVIEEGGRWTVAVENDESTLESFETRREALAHARQLARSRELAEILVETASGGEEHLGAEGAPVAG